MCGSVAKRIKNKAFDMFNLSWKEFKSREEQIFCKAYGQMKVSTPQNISSLIRHWT